MVRTVTTEAMTHLDRIGLVGVFLVAVFTIVGFVVLVASGPALP